MPFARWCYTGLFYLLLPVILLRLLWRARLAPMYRQRIGERFGIFSSAVSAGGIWVHAVSVGETIAAAPLIRALQQRYPHLPITVTTMTPTGSERVRALFGDSVFHVYAPYDLPIFLARFLAHIKPRLLIIMETELWPNTIHACAQRGIAVVLANARLSQKSADGYARLRAVAAPMLQQITKVAAQNAKDGARFLALGVPQKNLTISGSIKFDIELGAELIERAQQTKNVWGNRLVWIAASTHAGEDEVILRAHIELRKRHPTALLILVPRHPERFDAVARLIEQNNLPYQRRSAQRDVAENSVVLLGDTMGELLFLLGCADVAFVGGSLIARGGHNTLEPAAWGLPIITGTSDFNFREISALLQRAGALQIVQDADALAQAVIDLMASADVRKQRGEAARRVVENNRGALNKLLTEIDSIIAEN
ncbi:MAG: 3-deoxy-D-manno-octulosonic acid transferase [Verrucomicrobiaceae bacterium]|nr:3-deoxy-D-manno-octulosonic acid transferase [Verrucomicrobiaceae bacterium]